MPTGAITQRIRKDAQRIVEGLFSVELTITAKDLNGDVLPEFTIQGLATRHRQNYDPDSGLPIIGLSNHCSFSELTVNEFGIITRNSKNEIIVKGWLVSWTDAIGLVQYKIEEPAPDETVGIIKCILGEYE